MLKHNNNLDLFFSMRKNVLRYDWLEPRSIKRGRRKRQDKRVWFCSRLQSRSWREWQFPVTDIFLIAIPKIYGHFNAE
jgi:hypothetical protein